MMMSIFIPAYHVGFSPGLGSVQAINAHRSNFPTALTRARTMCKPERDIDSIRGCLKFKVQSSAGEKLLKSGYTLVSGGQLSGNSELADGSLMFSFGASHPTGHTRASHPSGNAKRANTFSSSHAEQILSNKNSFPRKMLSNFKKQSTIPISAEKTGNSIGNPRQQDTGSEMVQDNFDSEKVTGKTQNTNHIKRVYQRSQGSSPAYVKGSSISSLKGGRNKLSVEYEIADLFKQTLSTIPKKNPANNEKNDNRFSKSNVKIHEHPAKSVWRQYHEKNKEEFKEDASIRQSLNGDKKVPVSASIPSSRRGPKKTKYEKAKKNIDKSISEAFILSRPPSKFVRRSPIPLSAIKQDVRPVPGIRESEISVAESRSSEQDEGVLDSDGTPTSLENDSFRRDLLSLSEDKLNGLSELKLEELKNDGGILRVSDGTLTSVENGFVRRDSPSLSEDELNDLSELKLLDLRKTAKSYGLKGYSKLKKAELLELLRNAVRQS